MIELQYSTASGSVIDTAVKSDRARIARTTAMNAVTGVALSKSVTCGYERKLVKIKGMPKGYV